MEYQNPIVKENGRMVWENGSFDESTLGIGSAAEDEDYAKFTAGSGSYLFALTAPSE